MRIRNKQNIFLNKVELSMLVVGSFLACTFTSTSFKPETIPKINSHNESMAELREEMKLLTDWFNQDYFNIQEEKEYRVYFPMPIIGEHGVIEPKEYNAGRDKLIVL